MAIKRPSPVLQKPEAREKIYKAFEESTAQIQRVFDSNARVIGLTAETGPRNNYEVESYLLKSGSVNFNAEFDIVNEAVQHFQRQNLPLLARHRRHGFLWNQMKEIPVDVRMAMPFQYGNVCEDPERCIAIEEKGADSSRIICPECPVYTECQQRGYLSQRATLQRAKAQLFGSSQLLFDPDYSARVEEILKPINDTERLCIIDNVKPLELFLGCSTPKNRLEAWRVNWQGHALGNFASALLNTLEILSEPDDILVKRIRTIIHAFQPYESEIVKQMCQVNVRGKVVEGGITDEETPEELAHWTIEFEGGSSAYIPLNKHAADKLMAKRLPIFQLESFEINKDMKIPMLIEEAIGFNILDTGTVEKIQEFPAVYRNPDWTLWHRLKHFFGHYTRDADAR